MSPISAQDSASSIHAAHSTREPCRLLIVDDEPAMLFAYRRLLEGNGYQVDTCETLERAVEQIGSRPYFAVLTDLRLAGCDGADGLQVIVMVREQQPQAKIIVVTGCGDQEAPLTLGASYFFRKPLEPSVIFDVLRHLQEDARWEAARGTDTAVK